MNDKTFAIGHHRPVYLWGGPGTIRMNRLKFMNAPVDEAVHIEAHTAVGAERMAVDAGFNWSYLMYNWGFPPEIEQEDRQDFVRAVKIYQAAGVRVFGYVQASNCAYNGSYRDKDWYALDTHGRPFYYYTGRYMTCWSHPEWLDHLRRIVKGIIEGGADGVYYDNPWHGIQPLEFGGTWMGSAGCYCEYCKAAFRKASGMDIPVQISPGRDNVSDHYIRWRAGQVTDTLSMLSDYARSLRPDIVIGANNFDAVMRPSYLVYGIDLRSLAQVQDVIVIEDYGLPRWTEQAGKSPVLLNNALTLHTARALIGDTPLSTIPYDKGIGFDGVYAPRRFQQGIAEAAACGATMVVKGTEYVEDGKFTLLIAEKYRSQRLAIGQMHRWLAQHADLYRDRTNAARVALLHPGETLWQNWGALAPLYFGAGQSLIAEGIPWQVVTLEGDLSGLDLLLTFGQENPGDLPPDLKAISVPDLPGWSPKSPSFLGKHEALRSVTAKAVGWLFQSYFRHRLTRRIVDGIGLVHFFWQTPFFRLPAFDAHQTLMAQVEETPYPRVSAEIPVLAELWQQGDTWQLHLVNYSSAIQKVSVDMGQRVDGRVLSVGEPSEEQAAGPAHKFQERKLDLTLDLYAVIEYTTGRLS